VNGRFLLDTNIVIALIAKDSSVERGLASAEKVYVRVLPTVLRAPVDLRQVEGDLYDILGRPAKRARLGAGIYYLVAPERTRKLLVVDCPRP